MAMRWHAVHAMPRKERLAALNLDNQGFCVFLPLLACTIRHARRVEARHAPLFPRYLFVAFDVGRHRWRSIGGTFGVSALVMDGPSPRPIRRGVVEAIVEAYDGRGSYDFRRELTVGGRLRVLAGPFAETVATLVDRGPDGRVKVLFELFGAPREVTMPAANLIPAA
jgi:transcriptional antiterminator RfaH